MQEVEKIWNVYYCCDFEKIYFFRFCIDTVYSQVFAMYDETILSTLQAYIHDLNEISPFIELIIDILPTISDDQIPMTIM